MERTYGSLVRHELGSCYSALDGVPFKIGRAFRRPEPVTVPSIPQPRSVEPLSNQYSFETEQAVLAWAKARDEAVKKAAEEQAERQRFAEETTKANEVQELVNNDAKNQSIAVGDNTQDISVYDIPSQHKDAEEYKPPLPPKPSAMSGKVMSEPGALLTPIPIKRTRIPSRDNTSKSAGDGGSQPDSQLDLAMFEAEADPFDNLELQTLNDMEELKYLLNSDSVNKDKEQSLAQNHMTESPVSNISDIGKQSEVGTNGEMEAVALCVNLKTDCDSVIGSSNEREHSPDSHDEGEYVEIDAIQDLKKQAAASSSPCVSSLPSHSTSGLSPYNPHQSLGETTQEIPKINTQIYKPVLPPINRPLPQPAEIYPPQLPSSSISTASEASVNAAFSKPWSSPSLNGQSLPSKQLNGQGLVSHSPPPHMVSQSPPVVANKVERPKPSRPAPPPPVAAKPAMKNKPSSAQSSLSSSPMSMSTGPSLSMFLGEQGSPDNSMVHKNPYSRHCISTSDLNSVPVVMGVDSPRRNSAASSPQPWNRHSPLPPLPGSNSCKPNHFSRSSEPQGLSDPYLNLTKEEQAFTDSLTNMGFLRPRVARAVQKLGPKEREVLDYLFAVDKLGEQSFAPIMIESALFTYENDVEKAEKFLRLHAQFEELGFQRDKIRDALISTNLQHDQALDILTA